VALENHEVTERVTIDYINIRAEMHMAQLNAQEANDNQQDMGTVPQLRYNLRHCLARRKVIVWMTQSDKQPTTSSNMEI